MPPDILSPRGQKHAISRIVLPNNPELNAKGNFANNTISTSKFTVWSFLPRSLFEQFRRVANFYFLVIAILQSIREISPLEPFTAIFPLVFVLSVTLVKEGVEDYLRHKMDTEINNKETRVLRNDNTEWNVVPWYDVKVGDIVLLENMEQVPVDLLLLSGGVDGLCYVETSNLDGETNLKIKQALESTAAHLMSADELLAWHGVIECELPNNNLFKFDGMLKMSEKGESIPLTIDQMLLRGCTIRNTNWCIGIALYTGSESKLMKNQTDTPAKRSHVEATVNYFLYQIFSLQFIICFFCAIMSAIWVETWNTKMGYLDFSDQSTAVWGVLSFLTFVVLFNVMIPISLYVSLEIVKVGLALFISSDIEMYDPKSDVAARARTSNLPEELGQVAYVFSDKTGTLTENKMDFVQCSVGGVIYGGPDAPVSVLPQLPGQPDSDVLFHDGRLVETAKLDNFEGENARLFLTLLSTCHTVVVEKNKKGVQQYQAASPDEGALVKAAQALGYWFCDRSLASVTVDQFGIKTEYEILNVLEFNSTRKRMSVIIRDPVKQRIILFCKGADSVIFSRLKGDDAFIDTTTRDLEAFANQGLRTLCLAYRVIDESEYAEWAKGYHEASIAIVDRDELMDSSAEVIERDMSLIGATAIEDKLQDGVPMAIATIINAGVRVWVLTGDKIETAMNIGFACRLLDSEQELLIVDGDSGTEVAQQLEEHTKKLDTAKFGSSLIISGKALEFVIDSSVTSIIMQEQPIPDDITLPILFLDLAKKCKTVMCCRVSPLQKALVVRLVRGQTKAVTLAIGDGANDVGMIQKAHIGVGISGQEGMQAVLASDYAIAQFRFLERLLLVHGRYSYRRISTLMLYSFYKNFSFSLTNLWFTIFSGFGGSTLHSSETIGVFNVLFTGLPIIILAIFDKDVSPEMMRELPSLYQDGPNFKLFNWKKFWLWIANGLYQSVVFFFVPYFVLDAGDLMMPGTGWTIDMWSFGLAVSTGAIIGVNLRVAVETKYWTVLNWVATLGSVLIWFAFMMFMNAVQFSSMPTHDDFYNIFFTIATTPLYWFSVIAAPVIAMMPYMIVSYIRTMYFPTAVDVARELEHLSGKTPSTKTLGGTELSSMVGSVPASTPVSASVFARAQTYTGFAFSGESGEAEALRRTVTASSHFLEGGRKSIVEGTSTSVGSIARVAVDPVRRTQTSSSLLSRGRSSGRIETTHSP